MARTFHNSIDSIGVATNFIGVGKISENPIGANLREPQRTPTNPNWGSETGCTLDPEWAVMYVQGSELPTLNAEDQNSRKQTLFPRIYATLEFMHVKSDIFGVSMCITLAY